MLSDYLGGDGGKLKEQGTQNWQSPNQGATNSTFFSALPGGYVDIHGGGGYGSTGYWWSSSEIDGTIANNMGMLYLNTAIYLNKDKNKRLGCSVRCLKGEPTTSTPPQPIQGAVNSIGCDQARHVGELQVGSAASNVSSIIPYAGGNGGTHTGQTVSSTGVTGLTATLSSGTFANGNDSLVYTISGTPSASGTASFEINIGGKTCVLTKVIKANNPISTAVYGDNVTDTDGNTYKTVKIGNQLWMAENLRTTKYSNGDLIENANVENGLTWVQLKTGGWSYLQNNASNNIPMGKLYNWFTIGDTRNVCPTGWKVPSNEDVDALATSIGGMQGNAMKLKTTGNDYWKGWPQIGGGTATNNNGTNETGFSAFPSASRYGMSSNPSSLDNGNFYGLEAYFNIWTSSLALNSGITDMSGNGLVWVQNIRFDTDDIIKYEDQKEAGHAIRCLKNESTTPSQPIQGSINSIGCDQARHVGELQVGSTASNVSSKIPYTGGNGGTHAGQSVSSTGITGLTATFSSGTFANGNDSLVYTISGTPSASGTASFEINIGGKTCTLSRNVVSITPPTSGYGPNINDVDGNTYKTVYIGSQQWMAENLKTAKYNDGSIIPNVTVYTQWSNLTTGAWAYYNNDVANNAKYGKLYNWYSLSPTTNGNKNVCPIGWHVPTDAEWTVLTDYLGGESVAGGKLKEVGIVNWKSPNTDATNTSLFSALPGGSLGFYGGFDPIGSRCYWWSSTESGTLRAWYRYLESGNGNTIRDYVGKGDGLSVRCLKD